MKHSDVVNRISMTDIQNKIINNQNYPIYVKAGAGTGKTEVLIQKIILHILESDSEASLNNMVVISFTNKAIDEMKQRLADNLYKEKP